MNLIIVGGATATGKTELSIGLAQQFKCPILNFDSVQIFREFNIGTSKPSLEERKGVEHHLIDEIDPLENYSAGEYQRAATKRLAELAARGVEHVILVGGTGFYLRALLYGMYAAPTIEEPIRQYARQLVETLGSKEAHRKLSQLDEDSAKKVHENDSYRITRALELALSGFSMQALRADFESKEPLYRSLFLGVQLPREDLKKRVTKRTQRFLNQGLIEEAQHLSHKYPQSRALGSVGYKEVLECLKTPHWQMDALEEQIVRSTMLLAKRQTTWFKAIEPMNWLNPESPLEEAKKLGLHFLDKGCQAS
ncbi:MAG: tRNA (adenosine(37)-N6)-dimethylallyltransferase MiaA [Oligoflexia bacterium]|nr:tRNA (adenosine(37)-N6)-dimethylallyltransferase MiaA [Oligoflexia bacterium]